MLLKKVYWFYLFSFLFLATSCGVSKSLSDVPDVSAYSAVISERIKTSDSTFSIGNNHLNKNKQGSVSYTHLTLPTIYSV